ncbi:hypothetical protein DAPPUDRAFT_336005 [Daphnia pulex]|uniref:Uncharacterized protein n=1 Tax=Daphnia pulex TaxID=6669 RepID=E9HYX9_DAPPU|nr:hypothetical protein DAPPUDRAFT_336005 [Daphnia pulex]|eukprot:EFX63050.1 hypothetical protein DAPPUDRAFT_336005 [Daphnia pulex]
MAVTSDPLSQIVSKDDVEESELFHKKLYMSLPVTFKEEENWPSNNRSMTKSNKATTAG